MSVDREGRMLVLGRRYQIKPWWWMAAGWSLSEAVHDHWMPGRLLWLIYTVLMFWPEKVRTP